MRSWHIQQAGAMLWWAILTQAVQQFHSTTQGISLWCQLEHLWNVVSAVTREERCHSANSYWHWCQQQIVTLGQPGKESITAAVGRGSATALRCSCSSALGNIMNRLY
jgi:hypothetical protein